MTEEQNLLLQPQPIQIFRPICGVYFPTTVLGLEGEILQQYQTTIEKVNFVLKKFLIIKLVAYFIFAFLCLVGSIIVTAILVSVQSYFSFLIFLPTGPVVIIIGEVCRCFMEREILGILQTTNIQMTLESNFCRGQYFQITPIITN